ncbi:Putative Acyl-protein thioesterase 1 [[Torrubiella] hemipterigena]|uniref:Putative Acyl-protein thioesterase 1 n=1 Tax=[Torrubiella] hemipterigena TaxID=1531966 RepID=A0A0A1TMV4_9HYPO|nr:Putative Acyl-protein thioesterase 1 [[Torrubiella] hemipterigena]
MALETIEVAPTAGHQHSHTVIFLHGRGDNAINFRASLANSRDSQNRKLADVFPSFKWVFPQAPKRACASMFGEVWTQWFDVWNTSSFAQNEELQAEGLKEVVPQIKALLKKEADLLQGNWRKVILMGISMGSATSVHTLFNLDIPTPEKRLGAYIGFSGRCPFAGRNLEEMRAVLQIQDAPTHSDVLKNTPMLLEHCADDPLVPVDWGKKQAEVLHSFGANITWKEYPTGGHWFNAPQGMDDVVEFLNRVL